MIRATLTTLLLVFLQNYSTGYPSDHSSNLFIQTDTLIPDLYKSVYGDGISIDLDANCQGRITAQEVFDDFFENPPLASNIEIALMGRYNFTERGTYIDLDCFKYGWVSIALYYTDVDGESHRQLETITVSKGDCPRDNCTTPFNSSISGGIITPEGFEVQGVEFFVNGQSEGVFDNNYSFNIAGTSTRGDYDLTFHAEKNDDPKKGISIVDLVVLKRHLEQQIPITNPIRLLAADINGDGDINILDLIMINRFLLGQKDELVYGSNWLFVPLDADYSLNDIRLRSGYNRLPFYISDEIYHDLYAVKYGDLSGNAATSRAGDDLVFEIKDQFFEKGDEVRMTVKSKDIAEYSGYQFALAFYNYALDFVKIEGLSEDDYSLEKLKNGVIPIIHILDENPEEELFTVVFKAKHRNLLSGSVFLQPYLLNSEAYDLENEVHDISLNFFGEEDNVYDIDISPNPARASTTISLITPHETVVEISFFNMTGILMFHAIAEYAVGSNTFKVPLDNLAPGTYTVQVKMNDKVQTKQFIRI